MAKGRRGRGGEGGEGEGTFGSVACLVLAPVAEDFVFYPGHVFGVGIIVLLFGPLRHDYGCCS